MAANLDQIVDQLSTLSVLEAAELVKKLEEKWGVSAAAPVAMAAMPGAGAAAAAEPVEEKTEFDVVIKDPGAKKIDVINIKSRSLLAASEFDTRLKSLEKKNRDICSMEMKRMNDEIERRKKDEETAAK